MNWQALPFLNRKVLEQLVQQQYSSINHSIKNIRLACSQSETFLQQSVQQQQASCNQPNNKSPPTGCPTQQSSCNQSNRNTSTAISPTSTVLQNSVNINSPKSFSPTSTVLHLSVQHQQSFISQSNSKNPSAVFPSECSFHERLLSL